VFPGWKTKDIKDRASWGSARQCPEGHSEMMNYSPTEAPPILPSLKKRKIKKGKMKIKRKRLRWEVGVRKRHESHHPHPCEFGRVLTKRRP